MAEGEPPPVDDAFFAALRGDPHSGEASAAPAGAALGHLPVTGSEPAQDWPAARASAGHDAPPTVGWRRWDDPDPEGRESFGDAVFGAARRVVDSRAATGAPATALVSPVASGALHEAPSPAALPSVLPPERPAQAMSLVELVGALTAPNIINDQANLEAHVASSEGEDTPRGIAAARHVAATDSVRSQGGLVFAASAETSAEAAALVEKLQKAGRMRDEDGKPVDYEYAAQVRAPQAIVMIDGGVRLPVSFFVAPNNLSRDAMDQGELRRREVQPGEALSIELATAIIDDAGNVVIVPRGQQADLAAVATTIVGEITVQNLEIYHISEAGEAVQSTADGQDVTEAEQGTPGNNPATAWTGVHNQSSREDIPQGFQSRGKRYHPSGASGPVTWFVGWGG